MGCREEFEKVMSKFDEPGWDERYNRVDMATMFLFGRRSLEPVIREAIEAMRALREADRNKLITPSVYANLDNARIKLQSAIEED